MSVSVAMEELTAPQLVWSQPFRGAPGSPSWALIAPGQGAWLSSAEGVAALAWARERIVFLRQVEHLPAGDRDAELKAWESERAAHELADPAARLLFAEETLTVLHGAIRACRTLGADGQVDDVQPVCPVYQGRPGWPAPSTALVLHLERLSVPLLFHLRQSLMLAALGALERAVSLPAAWTAGGAARD